MDQIQHVFDLKHEDLRPISRHEFRATVLMLLAAATVYVGVMLVAVR